MNAQHIWKATYSQLELQMDRSTFDTWLRHAVLLACDRKHDLPVFVIGVLNQYAADMLNHKLYRTVQRVLVEVLNAPAELRFEVHHPTPPPAAEGTADDMPLFRLLAEAQRAPAAPVPSNGWHTARPERPALPESELNPRFTFDRFVVSAANQVAYEAACAVADYPGSAYNPLFVYGGVGMGKTHLLQAVAQVCQAKGRRALYIPSEVFTNDLVDAIKSRSTAMFRERYRTVDVLLVDDIQFIANKDTTQEEFFHTFNALVTFNKQIVLASDRPPSQLTLLEDRLRSRFAGGLVVDVQPPDLETRIAILLMWAQERGVELARETAERVALRAPGNIRELEGVFNQLQAQAKHSRQPLTAREAVATIERFESPRDHTLTLDRLLEITARHHGVSLHDLTGQKRDRRINQARQVAMYLARELLDAPLALIGEKLGGRSHTTVLHGCTRVAEDLASDAALRLAVQQIRQKLKAR